MTIPRELRRAIEAVMSAYVVRGCRAYRSSTQSIPNTTVTALSWDTEAYDTENGFAPTDSKLYARSAGYYMAGGAWAMDGTNNAEAKRHWVGVRKNGDTYLAGNENHTIAGEATEVSVAAGMFYMAVGDYIEIVAFHTQAAAKNASAASATVQHYNCGWLMQVV